jgi:O-antigen/teichoic acid export membrane protein
MAPAHEHNLTASTSWLMLAKTLAFAFAIAIPLLLVRKLPQHEFGLYKQIFLVINSAVSMLPLGFGMSAFYFLPRDENRHRETVFNVVLFTSAIGALACLVVSLVPSLLVVLFKEPALVSYAPLIGVVMLLWIIGAFLEIVTVANHEMKVATVAILSVQVTRALFFLAAAVFAGTVRSLVFAAVAQGIVQVAVLFIYLSSRFPRFWRAFDRSALRAQLAYSLPLGLAGLLYSLQTDLHSYFVSSRFGATAFAVYSIGCFQLPLFGILSDSVGSIMIPRVSLLQHQGRTREIVLVTSRAMRKLAAVYLPAYAFLLVARHEFMTALFTTRYADSIPIFAVNLTLIPLGVLLLDPVTRAYAQHRLFLLKLNVTLAACLALALWIGITRFGLIGAIAIVVLFNAIARVATLVKVIRILHVRARDIVLLSDVARLGVAAALAGLLTALVRLATAGLTPLVALGACAVFFSAVYVTAVVTFGIPTNEERDLVGRKLFAVTGGTLPRLWKIPHDPESSNTCV